MSKLTSDIPQLVQSGFHAKTHKDNFPSAEKQTMHIVHSLLFLVLSSNVTPQPALLYNWIQSPPAPAPALLYHPQYWIRPSPPLIQMPYFHTPAHPLEQDPEMVVILEPETETCSESVSSYPDPLYCDKYHICSGSVEDGWKVIKIVVLLVTAK